MTRENNSYIKLFICLFHNWTELTVPKKDFHTVMKQKVMTNVKLSPETTQLRWMLSGGHIKCCDCELKNATRLYFLWSELFGRTIFKDCFDVIQVCCYFWKCRTECGGDVFLPSRLQKSRHFLECFIWTGKNPFCVFYQYNRAVCSFQCSINVKKLSSPSHIGQLWFHFIL